MSNTAPYSCIIVDDEEMSRQQLRHLLEKIEDIEVEEIFENPIEAVSYLQQHEVDLVFLDIEMPEFTGLDIAKNLKDGPKVIFTTSKKEYAHQAFEQEATDYLVKPVLLPRLLKAIEKIRRELPKDPMPQAADSYKDHIFLKESKRLVRIEVEEILYAESLGDYVKFYTDKDKIVVHSTLKNIEKQLDPHKFIKVHRSFVVNISQIVDIEDNTLVIRDKVIPISRAQKPVLLDRIQVI